MHRSTWVAALAMLTTLGGTARAAGGECPRPNILLAISDDQSWIHASAYGDKAVKTPAFDRVAKSGVLFANAIGASPGCSPCRAALLTGRHTWSIEHAGTHASYFPSRYVVYPDLLEQAGYFVGMTGKGWGPGDWKTSGRGRNPAGPDFGKHRAKPPFKTSDTDYAANFATFLAQRPAGKPFCYWYGGKEPHRPYDPEAGAKMGVKRDAITVPPFLPDTPAMRDDLDDYLAEIQWFDMHLGRMLEALERSGELDNTLVIVTSDNGMPYPRAKANCYEYGVHMPLAIAWPRRVPGGRLVLDVVGFVDLTATILEAAGVKHPAAGSGPAPHGRSLMNILTSTQGGVVDTSRRYAFTARERHSSSRYNNTGYPQRAVRSGGYLYIRNLHPDRWPAGDRVVLDESGRPGPMHGGYQDIDDGPALAILTDGANDPTIGRFLQLAVAPRPAEELFDIHKDPGCLVNLAGDAAFASVRRELADALEAEMKRTGDSRLGDNPEVWETYPRTSAVRRFPAPPARPIH